MFAPPKDLMHLMRDFVLPFSVSAYLLALSTVSFFSCIGQNKELVAIYEGMYCFQIYLIDFETLLFE